MRSWSHHPSARLYMYLCMTADWTTGYWSGTRRRVALELGLSDQEYRTAMQNLEKDGLIEQWTEDHAAVLDRATQEVTQRPTQEVTQRATQVCVVIYKELGGGASPKEQPNEQPKSPPREQPQNNNINTKGLYGLTLARAKAVSLIDDVSEYIHGDKEDGKAAIRAFLDAMAKKQKAWNDEGDFIAHLMDWSLKQWLRVDSRLSAENRQQARRDRHARDEQEPNEKDAQLTEARRKTEYLAYCLKNQSLVPIVTAWYKQGAWNKEPLRSITSKYLEERPEVETKLREVLGFDIMQRNAG